jgi:hypothetical protein
VCVMDRSGSMSGDKLRLCKETLNFTIKQLHSKDRLAVVAYDNEVSTPLDLCNMDTRGKELAKRAVQRIEVHRMWRLTTNTKVWWVYRLVCWFIEGSGYHSEKSNCGRWSGLLSPTVNRRVCLLACVQLCSL